MSNTTLRIQITVLALCMSLLTACGKEKILDETLSKTSPLAGEWITGCLDMGGGAVNRIYGRFENDKGYVALLSFAGADCTGAYSMTDTVGNPIDAPVYSNDITEINVANIPDGFHAYTIRQVADGSYVNILMYFKGATFTEFVSAAAAHDEWSDWLNEPDVAGFAASPETFVPTAGGLVLQFSRGTLP